MGSITLILGGARSGKSQFAERKAQESGLALNYIATSQIWDAEMRARIDLHMDRRGPEWTTIEEPIHLCDALRAHSQKGSITLVDCLTLWVTNLMMAEADMAESFQRLIEGLSSIEGDIIFVSNEVGLGIVPENKMARDFRDHAGRLHQDIGAIADTVYFIAAGLPLTMKSAPV